MGMHLRMFSLSMCGCVAASCGVMQTVLFTAEYIRKYSSIIGTLSQETTTNDANDANSNSLSALSFPVSTRWHSTSVRVCVAMTDS